MGRLDGDVVVVTGASRGLGRELSLRFSREGARVVLLARDEEALRGVADEAPGETRVAPGDVTDRERMRAVVDETLDAFGRVDALVNNVRKSRCDFRSPSEAR